MPKEKDCVKLIPIIYKKNAENLLMFSWVNAQRRIVPAITIEQSIWQYFKFYSIDDWDIENAIVTYNQLQKEYLTGNRRNEIAKADR